MSELILIQTAQWTNENSSPPLPGSFIPNYYLDQMQTYIRDLSKHVGEEVTLKGWLYNLRSSGKLMFPQLRDGTGIVQCVVAKNSVSPEIWEALRPLGQESSLIVTGRVREDSRAPGGFEIDVSDAQVVQSAHDFPITPKEHGPEFL